MLIYVKNHLNDILFKNHCADLADILSKAYGAPPYIKYQNSFRSDHKQTLCAWVKIWENDLKFRIHGPFEPELIFNRIIKDNILIIKRRFYKITWNLWQPWNSFMK